jgi:carboxymethylenebutenolidase
MHTTGAVQSREFDVSLPSGSMNVWRFTPQGAGPWPTVFFLMDAPGLRPALHDMARTLAAAGYMVWMPNLYHRIGREVSVGPTRDHPDEAANRERMMGYIASLSNEGVVDDVRRLADHLSTDPGWDGRPLGLTGYCMSGRFAVLAARALGARAACAASYYGTRLVTDESNSPHRVIGDTQAELYFAFADHDPYVPPDKIELLRRSLAATPVRHRIDVYPGTEHGFVFSDRGTFDAAGADRHWATLLDLLQRHLRPRG